MQSLEREQQQRAAAADMAKRLAAAERRLADLGDAEAVIGRLQVRLGSLGVGLGGVRCDMYASKERREPY